MKAILTNKHIIVEKSILTAEEIKNIKTKSTYKDESVAYAIKMANKTAWGRKGIEKLFDKLWVKLYTEDEERIALPQGMKHLIPSHIQMQDMRKLPPTKELIWHNVPSKKLRYYQREAIDSLKSDTRGQACMATGSGKSFVLLNLVKEMGLKSLIICPSTIIGNQLYNEFCQYLGKKHVGMYGDGKKENTKLVTISLFQSVTKNIDLFKDIEMVLVDESQTLGASSLIEISRGLSHVPYYYSVSATNWRADGKTPEIYAASGEVKYSFDTKRAIKEGFLAAPHFIVREVPSSGGTYELKQKNYKDHVVNNNILNEKIIQDIKKALGYGFSTLVLVLEIEHGNLLAKALNAPFANGENKHSMDLIKKLNQGEIPLLIAGSKMVGVGVDTVKVDCLIMASFPGTEGLTLQSLGRGLRRYEGKEKVMVIDYIPMGSPMLRRHGFERSKWYREYGKVTVSVSKSLDI